MSITNKSLCLYFKILLILLAVNPFNVVMSATNVPPAVFITPANNHVFLSKLCGSSTSISDKKKSTVVLKFMSINCPPCKKELPSFLENAKWAKEIAKKNSRNINFFVVNVDPPSKKKEMLEYMKGAGVDIENQLLLDPYGKGAKLFNVSKIPQTFIISKNGLMEGHFLIFEPETYDIFKKNILSQLEK